MNLDSSCFKLVVIEVCLGTLDLEVDVGDEE